jgi:hypothetical protein
MQRTAYEIQREAYTEAVNQSEINFWRRLFGLRIKRRPEQVEIDYLAKHGLGKEFCTWASYKIPRSG